MCRKLPKPHWLYFCFWFQEDSIPSNPIFLHPALFTGITILSIFTMMFWTYCTVVKIQSQSWKEKLNMPNFLPRHIQFFCDPCLVLGCPISRTCFSSVVAVCTSISHPRNGHLKWEEKVDPSGGIHRDRGSRWSGRPPSPSHSSSTFCTSIVRVDICCWG